MKIAIIGYGIIGQATHLGLLNSDPDVVINDINLRDYNSTSVEFCDLIFICVPTGNNEEVNSTLHLLQKLVKNNPNAEMVVRSTIPAEYIDSFDHACTNNLVYCPEFLRERKWSTDCLARPVLVASNTYNLKLFNVVPKEECTCVPLKDAAIIKLMSNVFNSMRITFANHVYDYCEKHNANFEQVIPFIEKLQQSCEQSYLRVDNNLRGFGGKCLPKDLDFCIDEFLTQGLQQNLFTAIKEDNLKWPTTVRKDV